MAACCIFDEDEVCIPTSSGGFKYGMVVESSECVSSDDDSEPDESRVQRGQVKVAWHPSGTETVVAEDKVILTNRSLVPGDVVRRLITGEQSQRGFVQSVHTKCHVQVLGSKQYIYNVDAADIKPMQEFDPEPEVTLDSWVGAIIEVVEEITVKFPCGARCKLENAGSLSLEDIHDKRDPHSEFTIRNFYPGQELAGSYEDYVDAIWLYASNVRGPKMKVKSLYNATVVVEEVKTHSITVDWACKGFTRAGAGTDKLESPPDCIEGEDLKRVRRLDCFEYCHTQIGDKGFYVVKENDVVLHNISPRKHITPDILELQAKENVIVLGTSADGIVVKQRGVSERKAENVSKTVSQEPDNHENQQNGEVSVADSDKNEDIVKDIDADDDDGDIADDEFQDVEDDGSDSDSDTASIPSGAGSPAPNRRVRKRPCLHGVHRLKGKRARKKARQREREVKPGNKVPVEIAYTFSTCDVMWQNGTLETNVPSPELFPIHHLDELEFFPGDYVLDSKKNTCTEYGVIISCDHKERTVMVKWVQPYAPGKSNKPIEQEPVEMSVFDIKDHPDYKFRCESTVIRVGGYEGDTDIEAVGQVYKMNPDGTILVWWPDKTITSCYPQDLYFIGDEFRSESGSESEDWTDVEEEEEEEDGSDVSWETENEETDDENNESKHNKSKSSLIVGDDKRKELDGLLMRVQSAIWGLLMVFENTAVPYFKNSEQVFHDILAIFKRCKEFDKIIKSSFFDDQEVADLISNIKDELRKQKTGKLSRHVANIYKSRTQVCESNTLPSNEDSVKEATEKCEEPHGNEEGNEVNEVKGAEGGITQGQKDNTEMSDSKKALVEIMNTDDPLLQIILDTLLAQVASAKNDDKKSENSSSPSATGDFFKNLDSMKQRSMKEYVQSVIKSACENNDKELSAVIQNAKLKAKSNHNGEKVVDNETDSVDKDDKVEKDIETAKECGDGLGDAIPNDKCSSDEDKSTDNADGDQSDEKVLQPNHRSLCIRVCKALNVRVMQIKQEVSRKWLANKMGCDDSVSNSELYEKLQEKMIESVESGNGPLRLVSEGADILNEVDEAKNDVIEVNGENVHGAFTNGVQELESLVEGRASCESDCIEKSVPDEEETVVNGAVIEKGFEVCCETPCSHKFKYQEKKPSNPKSFMNAVRKEWNLLRTCLPDGIFVKVFEDRMDLMSVMIMGPLETPYEDGLFVFDIQLPADYPESPPVFHYHSFCDERLNPNLYEDGKVCVSLLGTWTGKGNECWTNKSSVLQVLVSIQGLILVPEPYFNEAGYEKQRGSQHGQENSRMYNEMAVLKLVQSMSKMSVTPPCLFVEETKKHIINHAQRFIDRVEYWVEFSNRSRPMVPCLNEESQKNVCNGNQSDCAEINCTDEICDTVNDGASSVASKKNSLEPAFPLLPASKGFCLTVRKHLECLKEVLKEHIFINSLPDCS
ncbi:E2/E3 hybrid ubiquitin-protein ligase ube2o [Mactra antiquata]